MFRSVYLKTLYNLRIQLFGWSLGIGFIAFVTMAFYNSFDQQGIESIVNSVPDSLKSLVGTVEDFKTVPGYIGQQIFGPNLYIVAIAAAVILALNISANEEDDKRLQTLLTLPVTRSSVFLQKWLALTTGIAIISAALLPCIYLGLLVVGRDADSGRLLESAFDFFLMNTAFASSTYAVALFIGKKGLSITIASAYATFSFIVSSLAPAISQLKDIDKLSILHYYNNPQVMQHGLKASHIAVLTGVTITVLLVSWIRFRKRNIGV